MDKIISKIIEAALAPLLAELIAIREILAAQPRLSTTGVVNTAPGPAGMKPVERQPEPPAAVPAPAVAAAPEAKGRTEFFRPLLLNGLQAVATGSPSLPEILAKLKEAAAGGEAVPIDARGLLGKVLVEIASEGAEGMTLAQGILRKFNAKVLREVPVDSYPAFAQAIIDATSPKPESIL